MVEQVSNLKTGVKYKDTPIGKIPVDWEVVELSKASEINMGMLILLPPLAEQKKIAEILTTPDDAIQKTAQIVEKTKVLKEGLMQRPVNKQKKVDEVLDPVDDDIEKESNYK